MDKPLAVAAVNASKHITFLPMKKSISFDNFLERYFATGFEEIASPLPGAYAIFLDRAGNVHHMGRVEQKDDQLVVRSIMNGETISFVGSSTTRFLSGVASVKWVREIPIASDPTMIE